MSRFAFDSSFLGEPARMFTKREWDEEIAAARLDAAKRLLEWLALNHVVINTMDDAALAAIVAPKEARDCPLCHKPMEVVSTSGCCMECYNKNTGGVRIMQEGWEIVEPKEGE